MGRKRIHPLKPKKSWLQRHTLMPRAGGCLTWRGNNQTAMTDQELAYHWLVEPLEPGFTIAMRSTCHKKCVNPEHMSKVYGDLEERRPGASQSPETVLRIRDHEGDLHDIARLFRASWQTVFNIKHGRSHRDITGLPFIEAEKKRKPRRTSPPRASED